MISYCYSSACDQDPVSHSRTHAHLRFNGGDRSLGPPVHGLWIGHVGGRLEGLRNRVVALLEGEVALLPLGIRLLRRGRREGGGVRGLCAVMQ